MQFRYWDGVDKYRQFGPGVAQSVLSLTKDWTTGVRSSAGVKDISSSLCVQTCSEAHPASYSMVPGGKAWRGVTLTTHPHLVPRSGMSRRYSSSPPWRLHGCSGTYFLGHCIAYAWIWEHSKRYRLRYNSTSNTATWALCLPGGPATKQHDCYTGHFHGLCNYL
jgi:hypothetical protein